MYKNKNTSVYVASAYPVLWQQSASSSRVEYRCKQGRHLGAAGHHQIGWCEMGSRALLPSSKLPLHFAPREREPQNLQLSTMGPALGLCSLCQTHRLLATWQCHSHTATLRVNHGQPYKHPNSWWFPCLSRLLLSLETRAHCTCKKKKKRTG